MTLSVSRDMLSETIAYVENTHSNIFPHTVFRHFYLDAYFNDQYHAEERIGTILILFTILGIVIACLGLLALISYLTEIRTKEIGIRKVFGASRTALMYLLLKDFILWLVMGLIVASPIAYSVMNKWLKAFAYRTKIDVFIFVFAGFCTFLIVLVTVSYQSFAAARANPIDSLRHE